MHCNTDRYFSATAAAAALSRKRETESKDTHSGKERERDSLSTSRCDVPFLTMASRYKVYLERFGGH